MKHLFAFVLVAMIFSTHAEILGPGTYYGVFATDRWGQKIFGHGTGYVFVSDNLAEELAKFTGKPLKLEVKEIYQPMNPGGGIITKIGAIILVDPSALRLEAQAALTAVSSGHGLELTFCVSNTGREPVTLEPEQLRYVLSTRNYWDAKVHFEDPENRAYWYYRDAVPPQKKGQPDLSYGCHEVILPWTPEDFAKASTNVELGPKTPTMRPPGTFTPLVVRPEGRFQCKLIVGKELPPGEYEVFFRYGRGDASDPIAQSPRLSFDVKPAESK